jgi:serine/threonine protein phosphatase 1
MRTFAVSDIHGNLNAFINALQAVSFKKSDRLIIVGDSIDRGSDSKGVLDQIITLKENNYNVNVLLGNHEKMLLDAHINNQKFMQWYLNGGDATLKSFDTYYLEGIPKKYLKLMSSFVYNLEIDNIIYVHASINMLLPDPYEDKHHLIWERDPYDFLNEDWLGNRIVIHGHTPKSKEVILKSVKEKHKIIGIDNGASYAHPDLGSLCILQTDNMKVSFFE